MKVLVAEDEPRLAAFVARGLEEQGFVVDECHRGDDALMLASTRDYDALVLDIMMPGMDGLSVLRHLRESGNGVPALMLSARGAPEDRVEGLNQGADDYLAKPFHLDELVARVHALLRRSKGQVEPVLRAGCLELAMLDRELRVDGEVIELTTREFALLACLMGSPGRVFARTQLCERVWNYHHDPGTNVVDVCVQRLRKKLGESGDWIESVRGVGYRFRKD
ncbi:response regulator transcription factor [Haloferula chungangensis]|uniref:Response regulator transcription factor n=1 Tax=Haloferula chungangensis TaxID=1048331 RepID=A0ABW2L517_9BACT